MKEQADETSQEERAIHLFPLPAGWKWVTVGDAGAHQKNAIVDGPFGSNLKVSDYVEGGPVPVLTTKNLEGNYDNVRYISTAKFEELKRSAVYPGDILMAKIGSCGKTGIYPANKPPAMIPANLLKVTLNDQFELKYVYHYFNSTFFQKALRTITKATAQPAFGVTNFRKLPLPYTARDQQKRIVAEIEKQFSRLDEAVANLKRVKANLKRYKAAVLKAAVEGHLVETEAELARREGHSYETGAQLLQRILETRRSQWQGKGKYKEPAAPDTTDLPELPEGWVWATIEQLTLLVTSGSRGWGDYYSDDGVLFIRAQDIKTDSLNVRGAARVSIPVDAEGIRSSVSPHDILITITGANVTKSALVPSLEEVAFVSQHVALLKLSQPDIASFVFNWIVSPSNGRKVLESWAYGAGKPGLSLEQVRALPVALPPLSEQFRIVAEVEQRLSLLCETEAQVVANLRRAERLRQSVLQRGFSAGLHGRDYVDCHHHDDDQHVQEHRQNNPQLQLRETADGS